MTLIRFKNQTEYSFIIWMDSFPESFHPLDMKRFYIFVKTVARYRSVKWRDYGYFKQQILVRKPHFTGRDIEYFHDLVLKCLEFHRTPYIDSTNHSEDGGYGYKQVGIKNRETYEFDITQDEWLNGGRKI
ncbi:hypothetical protein BH23PAT2_BH23PAT2_08660 [soil metagenome]